MKRRTKSLWMRLIQCSDILKWIACKYCLHSQQNFRCEYNHEIAFIVNFLEQLFSVAIRYCQLHIQLKIICCVHLYKWGWFDSNEKREINLWNNCIGDQAFDILSSGGKNRYSCFVRSTRQGLIYQKHNTSFLYSFFEAWTKQFWVQMDVRKWCICKRQTLRLQNDIFH